MGMVFRWVHMSLRVSTSLWNLGACTDHAKSSTLASKLSEKYLSVLYFDLRSQHYSFLLTQV